MYNRGQRAQTGPGTGRSVVRKQGISQIGWAVQLDLPDLPASLGFPIFRNHAPMGFGQSGLDQEMHDFKGFHVVY